MRGKIRSHLTTPAQHTTKARGSAKTPVALSCETTPMVAEIGDNKKTGALVLGSGRSQVRAGRMIGPLRRRRWDARGEFSPHAQRQTHQQAPSTTTTAALTSGFLLPRPIYRLRYHKGGCRGGATSGGPIATRAPAQMVSSGISGPDGAFPHTRTPSERERESSLI